jgi:nicotinate-nucleotide--dimethylbenzimidazole phosphoribosyltransferase
MQNTLKPRFRDPQLLVFAADHGLAVDGMPAAAAGADARDSCACC